MIQFIDEAIEALLRQHVPLPEATVDISFAAPDRAWGAGLTRPTINVFLWDIRRNVSRMTAGVAEHSASSGQVSRRPTNPVVDLRYLFTTWASDHRDEHQLLGALLRCILANSTVPPSALPAQLPASTVLALSLASEDARVPGEFWSSLDGRLKPGLQVTVSLPVDVYEWAEAGPPTSSVGLATSDMLSQGAGAVGVAGAKGGAGSGGSQAQGESGWPSRQSPLGDDGLPLLRRRRSNGILTMEGRPGATPAPEPGAGDFPAGSTGEEE